MKPSDAIYATAYGILEKRVSTGNRPSSTK